MNTIHKIRECHKILICRDIGRKAKTEQNILRRCVTERKNNTLLWNGMNSNDDVIRELLRIECSATFMK